MNRYFLQKLREEQHKQKDLLHFRGTSFKDVLSILVWCCQKRKNMDDGGGGETPLNPVCESRILALGTFTPKRKFFKQKHQ